MKKHYGQTDSQTRRFKNTIFTIPTNRGNIADNNFCSIQRIRPVLDRFRRLSFSRGPFSAGFLVFSCLSFEPSFLLNLTRSEIVPRHDDGPKTRSRCCNHCCCCRGKTTRKRTYGAVCKEMCSKLLNPIAERVSKYVGILKDRNR